MKPMLEIPKPNTYGLVAHLQMCMHMCICIPARSNIKLYVYMESIKLICYKTSYPICKTNYPFAYSNHSLCQYKLFSVETHQSTHANTQTKTGYSTGEGRVNSNGRAARSVLQNMQRTSRWQQRDTRKLFPAFNWSFGILSLRSGCPVYGKSMKEKKKKGEPNWKERRKNNGISK